MDKVIKTFISNIKSVDEEKGIVEAVVSDETIDRYRDVIKIDAWKKGLSNYKKHGVLLSSHNYNQLTNQIGVAESVKIVDKELVAKFRYFIDAGNKEADWGFFLAKQGLAAYSVGFLPKPNGYEMSEWDDEEVKAGKKTRCTYTDVELLEVSQVTVPANPSALQKSIEDISDPKNLWLKEYSELVLTKVFKKDEVIPEEIQISEELNIEEKDIQIEEDEVMEKILQAIEELKTYIDTKFVEISETKPEITKEDFDTFVNECKSYLVEIKEKEVVVEPIIEIKTVEVEEDLFDEEAESYLLQILDSNKDIIAKHVSVQS